MFRKGGGNHLTPPIYQETVSITDVLMARIHLFGKILGVFEQMHAIFAATHHFAAV